MTTRHNFWTGESWHITKNAYHQWLVKKIASDAILKKVVSLNSKLLTSPNEHRVRFHRYCFWLRFLLLEVRLFRSLHQSCRPGLLPARRLVACQARPPSRMNFCRFGLTQSVRAMAWPGPRPGQAKIVGLQANDSYFSYRDLEWTDDARNY
jgi:hypothetical protein